MNKTIRTGTLLNMTAAAGARMSKSSMSHGTASTTEHNALMRAQSSDGATLLRNFSGVRPRCFAEYAMAALWLLKKAFLLTHQPPEDFAPGLRLKTPA
jgi:hypothetical protein